MQHIHFSGSRLGLALVALVLAATTGVTYN